MSKEVSKELITKQRELLVNLRSELIGSLQTLPFTVYSDETIEDLLKAQPHSLEELCNVKGFPKDGKRVAAFGKSIVDIFVNSDKISKFSIHGSGESVTVDTELKSLNLF